MARRRPRKYTFEERLRDPNKRKNIPTSKLPAKYRRARQQRIQRERDARNPLLNPETQLSGTNLRRAAESMTDATLRPRLDALTRQERNIGTQYRGAIGGTSSIYRELAKRELDNVARQRALSEMTRARIGEIGQANVNEVDRVGLAAQEAMKTVSGPQGSAPERLAAERQALTARANDQAANWRSAGELAGQGFEQFTDAMGQARSLRGAESIERLATLMANRQGEVGAERASVAGQRGNMLTDNILRLRQQGFDNEAVRQGIGMKAADLQQEALDKRAGRRVQYSGQRTAKQTAAANRRAADERARANREAANERARLSRETAAAKARVTKQRNEPASSVKARQQIAAGRSIWRSLMRRYGNDEARVKRVMIEHPNYRVPPAAYNAIYDLERTGYLHPRNAAALRDDLGVVVPSGWRRRRGRSPTPGYTPAQGA